MELVLHPHFRRWLASLPAAVAAGVVDGIQYLQEHGRGAVLPLVRLRIQTSLHYPDMAEIRVDHSVGDRRYVVRVLACFVHQDQALLICVGGNKEGYSRRTGRDWYADYVPAADRIVDTYKTKGTDHE